MRAATAAGLAGVTVLAAAGLSAASSIGAATDGLSSQSILSGARFGETFGGASADRVPGDPDAPIRTGRWDAEPASAPIVLAGGPPTEDAAPAAPPAPPSPQAVTLAAVIPAPTARPRPIAALPQAGLTRAAFRPMGQEVLAGGPPRVTLSMVTDRDPTAPGSGLALADDFTGRTLAPRAQREPQRFDARRLLLSIAPEPADRGKGRWFLFAAGSGEAFGLNLVRDPARGGYRRAGWSLERLAEFGKAQLGLGWRKGDTQLAVSAARREIGAYGYKREDTVLGVTFTVSGQPPQKVKREQRLLPR